MPPRRGLRQKTKKARMATKRLGRIRRQANARPTRKRQRTTSSTTAVVKRAKQTVVPKNFEGEDGETLADKSFYSGTKRKLSPMVTQFWPEHELVRTNSLRYTSAVGYQAWGLYSHTKSEDVDEYLVNAQRLIADDRTNFAHMYNFVPSDQPGSQTAWSSKMYVNRVKIEQRITNTSKITVDVDYWNVRPKYAIPRYADTGGGESIFRTPLLYFERLTSDGAYIGLGEPPNATKIGTMPNVGPWARKWKSVWKIQHARKFRLTPGQSTTITVYRNINTEVDPEELRMFYAHPKYSSFELFRVNGGQIFDADLSFASAPSTYGPGQIDVMQTTRVYARVTRFNRGGSLIMSVPPSFIGTGKAYVNPETNEMTYVETAGALVAGAKDG